MSEEKDAPAKTPLVDLLRRIPTSAIYRWEPDGGLGFASYSSPIGLHAHEAASEITRLRGEVLGWQEIAADRQAAHSMAVHDYGELHSEAERLRGEVERLRGALTCIHEAKAYGTDQDCLNDLIDDNRTTARRALNLQGE